MSGDYVRICHLSSMARSGETLMLRTLAAHPAINVPWQITRHDSTEAIQFVKCVKENGIQKIQRDCHDANSIGIQKEQIVLIKQGIWEHKHPFNGFILVRNPASIYASLLNYDCFRWETDHLLAIIKSMFYRFSFDTNKERLMRWMSDIDASLLEKMNKADRIERFCLFYNRRMQPLLKLGLPVIHYERFVTDPEPQLRFICQHLGVPFNKVMLDTHTHYEGQIQGHGQINLGKAITASSDNKYQQLTRSSFDRVCQLTEKTWEDYGYKMEWDGISVETKSP